MAPVLKVLLEFLRILRFARDYITRLPGRWASLLPFLRRKLGAWWRFRQGKPSTFRGPKPAEPPSLSTRATSYTVSEGSAVVREYVVAASTVPASASHPDLRERAERQPATATPAVGVHPPTLTVDHPHPLARNPPHPFDGRSFDNRSLSAVSIQSRASDRYSIITNSRESIRAPAIGQPSRVPRATHRQFGRGPDPSRSRERLSRPASPTSRPHSIHQGPHIEVIVTNQPYSGHGEGIDSPVVLDSASSYTHEPLSPPLTHGTRRRQSSTSVVVDIQNPSTESLPISSPTNPPQLTDEPFAIDSATAHSSPTSTTADLHDESSQHLPIVSPPTSDYILPDGRFVQLINSDQVPRYTKDVTIPREETPYDVAALTTTFPYYPEPNSPEQGSLKQDSTPWIPATHPDGALYFYDPDRKLFTDTDMHNPTLRDEMEEFYHYLQQFLVGEQLFIPSKNYDLVLDIMVTDEERISWSYYYACHDTRCLFWLETYDASYMISELFGVKSPAHVRHRLEALYWNHWSLFPAVFEGRSLPLDAYDELMGILSHGCVDMMTSKSSTLPYDDDTMHKMIKLVQKAKKAKGGVVYYTAGTTRLLSFFAHWRFLYFHGQRHARLVRDQTVYDKPKRERSILITLLSPLLFLAPEVHLREMEKLWTDEVIIETVWKSFMTKLLGEWEDVILWSTVMLTANVGFLAIPGVVLSNLNGSNLTKASIGSIVIGLLLVRHNRTKQKEDPAGASTYLYQNSHRIYGLEPMAIIFSLPWALLMWSMVIFFIALLLLCFTISNNSTRILSPHDGPYGCPHHVVH
ncbi:hypothetical protein BJV74DRAFT_121406 [Russula compacta]|nr:hypothetical protein BJV74DRAFT_121406 [Russula compacta]